MLDDAEAQLVFAKTPFQDKGGNTSGPDKSQGGKVLPYRQHTAAAFRDKIVIATQTDFVSAKSNTLTNNIWGTDFAGDLISKFVHGTTTMPTTTLTTAIPIFSNQPGLSHHYRWKVAVDCQDTTYRFTFPNGVEASDDFESSVAWKQIIDETIKTNLAALVAAGGAAPVTSPPLNFSIAKDFIVTERESFFGIPTGINELGAAFGKVTIIGNMTATYTKTEANSIHVSSINFTGSFGDLYDFAFGAKEPAKTAAVVQAGHASLTGPPKPNSGKVFYTLLQFGGTSALNKNY